MTARVISSVGVWYEIESQTGIFKARLKGKFKLTEKKFTNPIAVGDIIEYEQINNDTVITDILQRKNYIIRQATHDKNKHHIVAANIDFAIILFSIKSPDINLLFLDKAIAACESYGIHPVLLMNKTDLLFEEELEKANSIKNTYTAIGYQFKMGSFIKDPQMIYEIMQPFANQIGLIFGNSGVGKTTLVNQIDSTLQLKTQAPSNYNLKGKHTTSFAYMYKFPHFLNISFIDTPGIKELDMVDIKKEDVGNFFLEINAQKKHCKYNNCVHDKEPACAVKVAVEKKYIAQSRYDNYLNIVHRML